MDLINSAKDVVRGCDIFSRLIKELAAECTDKDIHKASEPVSPVNNQFVLPSYHFYIEFTDADEVS